MSDNNRSKSPQTRNGNSAESPSKISDLNTLRALQKAAKKLGSRSPTLHPKEPTIGIVEKESPEIRKSVGQDSTPFGTDRSRSDIKSKNGKSPEEEYALSVRNKFQQGLSKLYAAETKDLVQYFICANLTSSYSNSL